MNFKVTYFSCWPDGRLFELDDDDSVTLSCCGPVADSSLSPRVWKLVGQLFLYEKPTCMLLESRAETHHCCFDSCSVSTKPHGHTADGSIRCDPMSLICKSGHTVRTCNSESEVSPVAGRHVMRTTASGCSILSSEYA